MILLFYYSNSNSNANRKKYPEQEKSILFAYDYHNLFNGNISGYSMKIIICLLYPHFLFLPFCSFSPRLSHYVDATFIFILIIIIWPPIGKAANIQKKIFFCIAGQCGGTLEWQQRQINLHYFLVRESLIIIFE
jgi:hypothetical protein